MKSIYKEVTNKIIQSLENGVKPWHCPWIKPVPSRFLPYNIHTGKSYSGGNIIMLWLDRLDSGYGTNGWLTFKQVAATNGSVRKGEHGSRCLFYERKEIEDEESGETKLVPIAKHFVVFNIDQVEGGDFALPTIPQFDLSNKAEQVIKATGVVIHERGSQAYYNVSEDIIVMPPKGAFNQTEEYYATFFHELAHWTGHKSRLNRRAVIEKFGDREAFEELVAELGSAFLCADLGITSNYVSHASYIGGWLKLLKTNDKAIFIAASLASKAHKYILPNEPC